MMPAWLNRSKAALVAAAAALVLAACATPPKIGGKPGEGVFERTGRFAMNVGYANGQRDALQGGFAWRDAGTRLTLDLANPLGSTLARIEVTPGRATVTRSNGEQEQAATADGLVEKVLGSPLPVSGLRYWLRGQTGPQAVSALEKNEAGQPVSFTQDGWRVRLSRYDALGPGMLQLNRRDANRDISARLVVNPN
ncbi:outer membrane lipoprotein LolB [Allopusillimonas soli]|uniref:Outer-membrane lipoprotein LolB n=1 Tax=Allopusillimonas soli TaxID=659016 RepID=A0A853FCD0_9BURK|nr:lipoprotein insertase outer membrane protein LolB [Allopusillimonas soli]NYT35716.1 outer membrane lipoprotein LolB [Allopusillimonas soli]TEA76105.1 outer membrane lipoprotein LolB [Allopusillimonas soli]